MDQIKNMSIVMSQKWLEEAEASTKAIKMPTKIRRLNCKLWVFMVNFYMTNNHSSFPCQRPIIKGAYITIAKIFLDSLLVKSLVV